jgi:hypothetical protein
MFGEAFPAGDVTPQVLRWKVPWRHDHALLLTMAKVNIVTTSLKVTLRKLVMKRIPITSMGDRVEDMIRMMRRR